MVDIFAEVSRAGLRDIRELFGLDRPVQHINAEKAAAILDTLPPLADAGLETAMERLCNARPAASLSGEEFQKAQMILSSGGGTANTAKIAAALGLRAAFAGCTGAGPGGTPDFFGSFFAGELTRAGVQTLLCKAGKPTGVFISLRAAGQAAAAGGDSAVPVPAEKTIAASPSAALELGPEDLPGFPPGGGPKIIMFEGFLMNRPALVRRCFELASQCGAAAAFDAGTAEIAKVHAQTILGWCKAAAEKEKPVRLVRLVLFINKEEAKALALSAAAGRRQDNSPAFSGWETLFRELTAKTENALLVAVKLAERGAAIFSGGEMFCVETRLVAGAESTGAGDAFAAGFLAALLRGESPEACGKAGNAAAALVLRSPGSSGIKGVSLSNEPGKIL